MPKDKKKKSKAKDDKKSGKKGGVAKAVAKAPKRATKSIRAISQNPLVADVVAAALVAMASALKDSEKARRLASDAGDELNALSKKAAREGNAMWEMALNIGRRTLHEITGEDTDERGSSSR